MKIISIYTISFFIFMMMLLTGCEEISKGDSGKVGVLLPSTVDDQGWNNKGYQGAMRIQSELKAEVFIKEDLSDQEEIVKTIEEFSNEGVTLIIGHSHLYTDDFLALKDKYPNIHFVVFNGEVHGTNITSLQFSGYAMGYFAGILSSELSTTKKLGVIAAFEFQPEVIGFVDGANYQNRKTEVFVEYVDSWDNIAKAEELYKELHDKEVDIYYPAGDGYHLNILSKIKEDDHLAIGYVGDQIEFGEDTILTSTVQKVDKLYEYVAKKHFTGELSNGNFSFDFKDGMIDMGTFGSNVPEEVRTRLEDHINHYKETGKLPVQD